MKQLFLLIMLLLAIPLMPAAPQAGKVLIVDLHYDNGFITFKDKIIKCGYSPDYVLQPDEGYLAELRSIEGETLASFTFDIPLTVSVDIGDPLFKTLSGGQFKLNETDFVLMFPHFDNAKEVIVYNAGKEKVLGINLINEQLFRRKSSYWWVVVLLLLISGYMVNRHGKRARN